MRAAVHGPGWSAPDGVITHHRGPSQRGSTTDGVNRPRGGESTIDPHITEHRR